MPIKMMQATSNPAPPSLAGVESNYSGIAPKLYSSLGGGSDRSYYVKLRPELEEEEDVGFLRKKVAKSKSKIKRPRIRLGSREKSRFAAAVSGRTKLRFRLRRPKIRLGFLSVLLSPVKLLKRLRDGYVSMMLSLAARGDFSGAVMGNAVYIGGGQPCRGPVRGLDARKEDEIMAYIEFLRRTGRLVPDPVAVMDR